MTSTVDTKIKKKKGVSLERHKARAGWMFVLPFIIGFVLIYLPIVFDSIKSSFCEIHVIKGTTFVGWSNYTKALLEYATSDGTTFPMILLTGLQQLVLDTPAILIFSLFMAVLLNQKMAGRAVFRAIFFVPVILSTRAFTLSDRVHLP